MYLLEEWILLLDLLLITGANREDLELNGEEISNFLFKKKKGLLMSPFFVSRLKKDLTFLYKPYKVFKQIKPLGFMEGLHLTRRVS